MTAAQGLNWVRALRPAQWLKNAVVPAAYFFARWDPSQSGSVLGVRPMLAVGVAVACFCSVSSGIYLVNDLRDIEADRAHPIKRLRPLAAGLITPSAAGFVAVLLLMLGLAGSWGLPTTFFVVLLGYVLMQIAYTFVLKKIPYVDVFVIAIGFVLRAIAGAAVLTVRISPWLLLCTFLLALFLALCKRRHEKVLLEAVDGGASHRVALVYRYDGGGRPEKTLLTDKVLIGTVVCFILSALAVFLLT